ncbi:MAG TPA: asparagine synthase (glutamine-hydrolyzing) [Flavobacteriales bacterium]|nr:asparagine synthase (glutamine-hydrolyzing) [Flavobacteriales bacterium]HMW97320.1 asparagine synthase (glutamine-hydrolyzing) [Flavobacteriales bacterium]HNI03195.1 asparagine synthase (glutamine-hydrolyzing) [Flavobacteriales bacterium]HNK67453.1 asparagine synthase (glutamine-hydrolyzing) [Flavobacteriales bacterium]HNM70468.1 asparagine synthase (glutamine-hydrolyzing) [Flavobacteriales bacterium]
MCGIAAIIHTGGAPVDESALRAMMRAMKHRGPDDEGVLLSGNAGLGFVRLGILDLSSNGHQPMTSADGRFTIIYNGEIFNYIELREELRAKGHVFRTGTDTEVLLAAYAEWGRDMLHRLNGMWAFILLDVKERALFCARDRYGIKPFYHCADGDRILIASDPTAILAVLGRKPLPDHGAILNFLAFNRTDQDAGSFFQGITKLPHGHFARIDLGRPAIDPERWYYLRERLREPLGGPEDFLQLLTDAVALRLRSDVPVGICLSGGLDSASIACLLAGDLRRKDVRTFSAVYGQGRKGDESGFIALLKDRLTDMHATRPDEQGLMDDLDDLTRTQCEPVPSTSIYAQYRVMRLAHEHVTVTLDGQGADELLGGYDYFFGFHFKQLLRQGKALGLAKEVAMHARFHRSSFGLRSLAFFMLPASLRARARMVEKGYIHPEFVRAHMDRTARVAQDLYGSRTVRDALLDHFEHKLEHLLKWADRNSMRFSVEARMPFLDHRLVEQVIPMAERWFIHRGMTKQLLREAMRGRLPEAIRTRADKMGFETPEADWFRSPGFRALIQDMLHSTRFAQRGIVDVGKAQRMYADHLAGRSDRSRDIWKLIHLEKWFTHFID